MRKNYKPINMGDSKNLTNEEWLEFRKPYIGGSAVSTVMGVNPWNTKLDLIDDKKNKPHKFNPKKNQAALDAGHRYEDIIAKEFGMIMNTMLGKKCILINDTGMYLHGEYKKDQYGDLILNEDGEPELKYPFALANLDRKITINGKDGILEVKTTSGLAYEHVKDWKNGIVPVYYELQCRYYMAVMNLDFCYIVCKWGYKVDQVEETSWGFVGTEIAAVKIERDYEIEDMIMSAVSDFYFNCIVGDELPDMTDSDAELVIKYYTKLYGLGDERLPEVELSPQYASTIEHISSIDKEIAELNSKVKALEEGRKSLVAQIAPILKESTRATIMLDDNRIARITYRATQRDSFDAERLKSEHPEIWDEVSKINTDVVKTKKFSNQIKNAIPGIWDEISQLDNTAFKKKHPELVNEYLNEKNKETKSFKVTIKENVAK